MKTILLTISLFIFSLSFSQTTFIVTTANGQPAVGAEVYKSGEVIGKTDGNGEFTIERISRGDKLRFLLNLDLHIYTAKTNNPKKNKKISLNLKILPPAQEQRMDETTYKDEPISEQKLLIYNDPQVKAEFPGGQAALSNFILENLKSPIVDTKRRTSLRFVIMVDGSIDQIEFLRKATDCPECDAEAIRIINIMPKWTPAKMYGKNVPTYYRLAIIFEN